MTKKSFMAAIVLAATSLTANAGGMLTNTNQSVTFLRNPARDAAIGIDGTYNNPAGVALMKEGWHIGVNWQMAIQTRTVETTSPYLDQTLSAAKKYQAGIAAGLTPDEANAQAGTPTKQYRGHASAPCIPSLGLAYNKGKWSYQFNFAITGGGGKCEFGSGLGTFDNAVGQIAAKLSTLDQLNPLGISGANGYAVDSWLEGSQYYYGATLGAAYKVLEKDNFKLSVYGGIRALIGSANYKAKLNNILVASKGAGLQTLGGYLDTQVGNLDKAINQLQPVYQQYGPMYAQLKQAVAAGAATPQMQQAVTAIEAYQGAVGAKQQLQQLEAYRNGLDLECDQSGFGIAPILGVDAQYGRVNFAAKYEFRTKMNLKNTSNLKEATLAETAQFVDGGKVREDSPALLAIGLQYSPIDIVRINTGYHHFYDKQSKKHSNKQELLEKGTNEYLMGVEVDVTDRLIVSAGAQITRYGNTDKYISDLSFVCDSWSFGFGASYQANPNVKIEAAYFRTNYDTYKTATNAMGITNSFTRGNDVIGVGLVIDL